MTRRSWAVFALIMAANVGLGVWAYRAYLRPARTETSTPASGATVELFREPVEFAPFTFTDLEGRQHSSSDWSGKVVLLNFWATWCPPCRAEIPDLVELQNKYRDQLVVVGLSEDEGAVEPVKKFADEVKMNYIVAMSTPEIRKLFRGVVALPTTFVIGPDGRIEQKHVGMLNPAETEAETRVLSGLDTSTAIVRVESSDKVRLANAAQAKTLPGVDLTHLSEEQRKVVVQALIDADCTCGCSLTVAECRLEDPSCPISLPLAQNIVKSHTTAQ